MEIVLRNSGVSAHHHPGRRARGFFQTLRLGAEESGEESGTRVCPDRPARGVMVWLPLERGLVKLEWGWKQELDSALEMLLVLGPALGLDRHLGFGKQADGCPCDQLKRRQATKNRLRETGW